MPARQFFTVTVPAVFCLLGWCGQGIGAPLWLASFLSNNTSKPDGNASSPQLEELTGPDAASAQLEELTGPYFVVFFASLAFNFLYWPLIAAPLWRGSLAIEIRYACSRRGALKLFAIGLCNGANGLLRLYASSTHRVPGALQPILAQATLFFTVLGSSLCLGKTYGCRQLAAVGLVLIGIAVSLLPTFVALAEGDPAATALQSGPAWPFVFVLSCVPLAAMNILQESVFDDLPRFSVPFLLAVTSLLQFLFVASSFWTDIIAGFGASGDLRSFITHMTYGFGCFFHAPAAENPERCALCAPLGVTYFAAYVASYFFGGLLVRGSSANFQSLLVNLASALCIYFWIAFPRINTWSSGKSYSTFEIVATSAAVGPIALGTFLFRYFEPPSSRQAALDLENDPALLDGFPSDVRSDAARERADGGASGEMPKSCVRNRGASEDAWASRMTSLQAQLLEPNAANIQQPAAADRAVPPSS